MHVALGYAWLPHAAAYHLERGFAERGHQVSYVGLPSAHRSGYDSAVPLDQIVANLHDPVDFYLWVDPLGRYFPAGLEQVSVPTACYLIDVHLGGWRPHAARFFDVVFVAQKNYVDTYRQALGHNQVYWLPLAAAPDFHRDYQLPRIYDVGFVGSINIAHRRTPSRARRMQMVKERYQTNDFYQFTPADEVGRVYSQAKIVFNTSIAGDITMRVFEATASGAMLITDTAANGLPELFEIGKELVVFEDDDDLCRKIDYYLAHDDERAAIGAAGCRRTQAEHTYAHRAQTIAATVMGPSIQRLAPMRSADQATRDAEAVAVYTELHMLDAIYDQLRVRRAGPVRRLWVSTPGLLRRLVR
jgi:glycosyltransferase involved in cell wall biosynthesis